MRLRLLEMRTIASSCFVASVATSEMRQRSSVNICKSWARRCLGDWSSVRERKGKVKKEEGNKTHFVARSFVSVPDGEERSDSFQDWHFRSSKIVESYSNERTKESWS